MRALLLISFVMIFSASAFAQKDKAIVEDTRTGQQYEVKVPSGAVRDVRQTGPNTYDVHVDRSKLNQIEIKQLPSKK
jgi:hypothetical protein